MYTPGMNPPESISFGSGSAMFLGSMAMYQGHAYPITLSDWEDYGKRMSSEIMNNPTTYFDFLWSVEFDNGAGNARITKDLKFTDMGDLATYIAANIANTGGYTDEAVVAKCYAKVSSDLDGISKVYGLNRFYSVLKGRRQYKVHHGTYYNAINAAGITWGLSDDFAADLWDSFTFPGFVDRLDPVAMANAKRSIWFSTTHNKIHGLLKIGQPIEFINGENKGRHVFDWGSSSWGAFALGSYNITDKKIAGLAPDGLSYTITPGQNMNDKDYYTGESLIRVYRLDYSTYSALYIKPMGVDTFVTNYVNNNDTIRLYLLAYNGTNDLMPRLFRLDTILGVRVAHMGVDIGFRVLKNHIINFLINVDIADHIGHTRQKEFRLFVGDGAGNISPLSVKVSPKMLTTGSKIKILVN